MTAEVQVQLVDVLLKENDSLTNALSTVTQEKAELCRAASRLEKTLKHHLLKGCALSVCHSHSCRGGVKGAGLPYGWLPGAVSFLYS